MTRKSKKLSKKESGDISPSRCFFSPFFIFGLDCCKEIPQLWIPDRDDGAVAVPEERICQGWIHQHLCGRQRNWASLRRRGQAPQQVLTDLSSGSVSPFTDSSPCCLKIYFIIMLSGWHPYDFTCSSVLVRDKSASPWRKEKAALVWGVETLWNLNLRSGSTSIIRNQYWKWVHFIIFLFHVGGISPPVFFGVLEVGH